MSAADFAINLTVTARDLAALSRGQTVELSYTASEDVPDLPDLEIYLRLGEPEDPECE